jgi:hypothetical protein
LRPRSHEAARWNLFVADALAHDKIGDTEKISDGCLRVLLSPQFGPRMTHPIDRTAGLNGARISASKCRKILSSAC